MTRIWNRFPNFISIFLSSQIQEPPWEDWWEKRKRSLRGSLRPTKLFWWGTEGDDILGILDFNQILTICLVEIVLQKLKKQRDELKKYQKRVNAVIEDDRLLAKKLLEEGKKE